MARNAYVCTVQIILPPDSVRSEGEACDAVSELLRPAALDWQYLEIGGQRLTPQEKTISWPYEEGDGFS